MEGGGDAVSEGGVMGGAATVLAGSEDDIYACGVRLSQVNISNDVESSVRTVFEVIPGKKEEDEVGEETRSFFDDDSIISSLRFGAGSGVFSDDEQSNSDDDGLEPFEKLGLKMDDLTGDGGVMKMEVRGGIGGCIPSGASVVFHYSAFMQYADEPFDCSYLRNKPENKVLDSGDMLPGLNIAIKTMRKGERARFLFKPHFAYGKLGCYPRIPPNETILYEINLLSFVDCAAADTYEDLDEQAQHSTTFEEKLEAAKSYHRQGNAQYRDGSLAAAKSSYFRAAWIMENARVKDIAGELKRGALLIKMRSNLAQVFLDLKEPARACTQCRLGLEVSRGFTDDIKAKLYYRLGKAMTMLNEFKDARKAFQRAQRLKPNNLDIGKELEALLQLEKKYTAKERFMCQKMFASSHNTSTFSACQNHTPTSDQTYLACTTAQHSTPSTPTFHMATSPTSKPKSVLPSITPEFEHLVEERVVSFALDPSANELPFPSKLSEEEVAFIVATAKVFNLSIHYSYKGRNKQVKLLKKQ